MKKKGSKRILETRYLYCNKHGDCEHVESGIKVKRWKCCACTVEYSKRYKKRMKQRAVEYKGGACELCGYKESLAALTFHHVDPLLKNYNLAGTKVCRAWDKLVLELDKCQLLCLNCHYALHAEESNALSVDIEKPKKVYDRKTTHKINAKKLGKKVML